MTMYSTFANTSCDCWPPITMSSVFFFLFRVDRHRNALTLLAPYITSPSDANLKKLTRRPIEKTNENKFVLTGSSLFSMMSSRSAIAINWIIILINDTAWWTKQNTKIQYFSRTLNHVHRRQKKKKINVNISNGLSWCASIQCVISVDIWLDLGRTASTSRSLDRAIASK